MKFQTTLLLASSVLAASRATANAPDTAVANATAESGMSPQDQCALACNPSDVGCRANCNGVPNPSGSDIQKHTECTATCNKDNANNNDALKACFTKCSPLFTPTATSIKPSATAGQPKNATNSTGGSVESDAESPRGTSLLVTTLAILPFLASYF